MVFVMNKSKLVKVAFVFEIEREIKRPKSSEISKTL